MRIDMNTPVDLLMHGGDICYIDLDEGELCHWKYIKREKIGNGKYRYYYDQSELDKAKSDAKNAQDKYQSEMKRYIGNRANISINSKIYNETPNKYAAQTILESALDLDNSKQAMDKAAEKANKLTNTYRTKAITSFPARTISKGMVKIANLFSGLFKKK